MEITVGKAALIGVFARFGTKSTMVCSASIETAEGVNIEGAVWARLTRDKDTGEESVSMSAGYPKGVKIENEDTEIEIGTLVMEAAQVWAGWEIASDKAIARLTAERSAGSNAANKARIVLHGKDLAERKAVLDAAKVPATVGQVQHDS